MPIQFKIAPGIAVTYNGRPYGGKIADVISKLNEDYNTGNIYLKDSDKDGTYDYMLINCYSTFVVTSYSDNTIHNKPYQTNHTMLFLHHLYLLT